MESWPSVLPLPSLDYTSKNEPTTIRTQMASGRVRQRRRFTSDMKTQSLRIRLTEDQYGLFQSFVFYKLNGGNDFFQLTLLGGQGLQLYNVRLINGEYTAKLNHPHWDVTANVDVEEQGYIPEDAYDALVAGGGIEAIEKAVEGHGDYLNS